MSLVKNPLKVPMGEYISHLEVRALGAENAVADVYDYFKGQMTIYQKVLIEVYRQQKRIKRFIRVFRYFRKQLHYKGEEIARLKSEIHHLEYKLSVGKRPLRKSIANALFGRR